MHPTLPIAASLSLASTATAGFFSATASASRPGSNNHYSQTQSSTESISASISHDFGSGLFARAGVDSDRAFVWGGQSAKSRGSGPVWGNASGTARADDIVITSRDGMHNGDLLTVHVAVTANMTANISETTPSTNWFDHGYSDFGWSASVQTSLGSDSISGQSRVSFLGLEGSPLGQEQWLDFTVIVGEAFTMTLSGSSEVAAKGYYRFGAPDPFEEGTTENAWYISLAGGIAPGFVAQPAFILPEGFTANSVDFGIVDNTVVNQLPTPGTLAVLGAAAVVGSRRRR